MTSPSPKSSAKTGIVTFLDVLGWKGVYQRLEDPLERLQRIVDHLLEESKGLGESTEVKSISDTIAIFTKAAPTDIQKVIDNHGLLCAKVIVKSIQSEIPLRGATSFGEFEISQNIFVGKAIDEAASWYEQSDWIGVHLTPSAHFVFDKNVANHWKSYEPPVKNLCRWETCCVSWVGHWKEEGFSKDDLEKNFRAMGPIVPDIAPKFFNTMKFYEDYENGKR